jgi:DNA-directed RNA polymerase subunit H (RpoH/RPB5)
LKDRSYRVPQSLFGVTETEFMDRNHWKISGIVDKGNHKVFVYLFEGFDLMQLYKDLLQFLREEIPEEIKKMVTGEDFSDQDSIESLSNLHLIIIYGRPDTLPATFLKIKDTYIGHPFIETFDVSFLSINPKNHIYQPIWELMEEKEITEMLQLYEAKSFPTSRVLLGSVCIDDPMNRYYGGKPGKGKKSGDVYKITRDGCSVFYRKVIAKKMNL